MLARLLAYAAYFMAELEHQRILRADKRRQARRGPARDNPGLRL